MARHLIIFQIILVLIFFSCTDKPAKPDNKLYFDKNELSDDDWNDSIDNKYFSELLTLIGESPLKDTANKYETIRLTVPRSIIFSSYCIRLDKVDSMYVVNFKRGPDPKTLRRTGLNDLALTYKSDFGKMDTIYRELVNEIKLLDIFNQDNTTPEIVIQKGIVGADGITFLLEYYKDGKHTALVRWDGFLDEKFYKKSEEFTGVVRQMHALIPKEILPDYLAAREIEDVRFPIFKKNKQ